MLAYHNNPELKQSVLDEMASHRKADNLVQGYAFWENAKGCAVGCLIKSADYAEYETRFGIPQALARLEDCIFKGLPVKDAKKWPERFLNAINTGADLSLVQWKFLHWNLTENLKVDGEGRAFDGVRAAIAQCADVLYPLTKGEKVDGKASYAAIESARDARAAAEAGARPAMRAETWEAAEAATESVRLTMRAASALWSATCQKIADGLIELLENESAADKRGE